MHRCFRRPEALPGPINIVQAMLRVTIHHWWKILAIWAVLTAGGVYAIHVRIKPVYESYGLLRVEPANLDLFNLGTNSAEGFAPFLETQVELIRSPNVLNAALAKPAVVKTTLVSKAKDPEARFARRLSVGILGGTYLIRVALTSQEPGDGPVIVNEIIQGYMHVATEWSDRKNAEQITRLKTYGSELDGKVEEQKANWLSLAEQGIVDLIASTQALATPGDGSNSPQTKPGKDQASASLEEYRQVRGSFSNQHQTDRDRGQFQEPKGRAQSREAGVDPELLDKKRRKDALQRPGYRFADEADRAGPA